ncbi:MAG: hypothetical protein RSG77_21695 [Hafnia sp.]
MSRYQQQRFEFMAPRNGGIITFSAGTLVKPREFMGVVNQHAKLKIHAVVDTSGELVEHQVLVVGTGHSIDESLIDKLIKIGTLNFADGQYGYHFYLIHEEPEVCEYYKDVLIVFKGGLDPDDVEDLSSDIFDFASRNETAVDCFADDGNQQIKVRLKNKEAEFEKTPAFRDFILNLSVSDLVDVTVTNVSGLANKVAGL